MEPRDRIAVVIVSYNTVDHLRRCLSSIIDEAPAQVTVVDNGSTDGSGEMVEAEFPQVDLVVDRSNPGFGAAANRGIGRSSSPYVLLLNADTWLKPGTLAGLVQYLDSEPKCAVLGPRIEYPDGRLQHSCAPFLGTFQLELERSVVGPMLQAVPLVRDRYLLSHWTHDRPRKVPWVLGAALAIQRHAFESIGGFDEAYFLFAEEVDLCYRFHQARWEVHFAPVATVVHVGGASTSQDPVTTEMQRIASAMQFCGTHYSPSRARYFSWLVRAGALARLSLARTLRLSARDAESRRERTKQVEALHAAYLAIRAMPAGKGS